MRVFISYRREDSAGHTGRLFDSLRSRFGDDNVFLDLADIDSGQVFTDTIQQAIRAADVVLAIIGRDWLTCTRNGQRRLDDPGDLVRLEIATALDRNVPVIPVLINAAAPPAEQILPAPLQPLARRDAHEITDERWAYDVERLVTAMERLAGPSRPRRPRWAVAAAVAAVLVAIVAGVSMYSRFRSVSSDASAPAAGIPAATDVAGTWTASVTYPWGAQYTERFMIVVDRDEISGTASFLGVARGILDATVDGNRIRFATRTTEVSGDVESAVTHHYSGRFTRDAIEFTMRSDRPEEAGEPLAFTAARGE